MEASPHHTFKWWNNSNRLWFCPPCILSTMQVHRITKQEHSRSPSWHIHGRECDHLILSVAIYFVNFRGIYSVQICNFSKFGGPQPYLNIGPPKILKNHIQHPDSILFHLPKMLKLKEDKNKLRAGLIKNHKIMQDWELN